MLVSNYVNTLNTIENDVRIAYANMLNSYESLELLDSNIQLSKDSYQLAQDKYDVGKITLADVNDAFQNLSNLEISASDSVLECVLAVRKYEYSYSIGVGSY